jgi:hypothetical protein
MTAMDKGKFFQTGVEWLESHRQFAAASGMQHQHGTTLAETL